MIAVDLLEHEGRALARRELEVGVGAPVPVVEGDRREEREAELGREEDRTLLVDAKLVLVPAVVEARLDLDTKRHLAAHADDAPDQRGRGLGPRRDRHEVLHLADAVRGEEARDQNVRVGPVELLRRPFLDGGRDPVTAALLGVEDRGEDARRVEARAAEPVDRPVGADERHRVQVADHAVLGDREVIGHAQANLRQGRLAPRRAT